VAVALTFSRRWIVHTPEWLGNNEQPQPFKVKFARMTTEELRACGEQWAEIIKEQPTADDLERFFDGKVQGPSGAVEIDGTVIDAGDLRGLLEFAAREPMIDENSLAVELFVWLRLRNHWSEEALGNSERRRTGSGGTAPPQTDDSSHRADAGAAAVSSTTADTSSGPVSTTGAPAQ
jgi:hypothetical protein